MTDRSLGDHFTPLRTPDVRISHVDTQIIRASPPFDRAIHSPDRSIFAFTRSGAFALDLDGARVSRVVPQGTAIGIENGRPHVWRALEAGRDGMAELLLSSIPRRISILQRLNDGIIVVPSDMEPYATTIRLTVDLHAATAAMPAGQQDQAVIRRCAEICLIQFITFARAGLSDAPAGLAHDEHLVRAWTAYFADPQRRWTVKALADAAGLGRTAFAERFRTVFGAPPLQTLTRLRLEQAESLLRHSTASLIEIAFTIGYNSEAAFVRAFHRQYGMPPGRFRWTVKGGPGL